MLLNLYSIYQTLNKSMYKVNIYCYKYTHFSWLYVRFIESELCDFLLIMILKKM